MLIASREQDRLVKLNTFGSHDQAKSSSLWMLHRILEALRRILWLVYEVARNIFGTVHCILRLQVVLCLLVIAHCLLKASVSGFDPQGLVVRVKEKRPGRRNKMSRWSNQEEKMRIARTGPLGQKRFRPRKRNLPVAIRMVVPRPT